ncbi:MAG TPA: hypothetical protein VGO84_09100 [Burkholderiales bacterium]|jgi:hypothetical protein|nr:hypothetical protein [Burkholderiales bacterium]
MPIRAVASANSERQVVGERQLARRLLRHRQQQRLAQRLLVGTGRVVFRFVPAIRVSNPVCLCLPRVELRLAKQIDQKNRMVRVTNAFNARSLLHHVQKDKSVGAVAKGTPTPLEDILLQRCALHDGPQRYGFRNA